MTPERRDAKRLAVLRQRETRHGRSTSSPALSEAAERRAAARAQVAQIMAHREQEDHAARDAEAAANAPYDAAAVERRKHAAADARLAGARVFTPAEDGHIRRLYTGTGGSKCRAT